MINKQNPLSRGVVKYGQVAGSRVIVNMPVGASEVFTDTGAKFVIQDGSGYIDAAEATSSELFGWAECGAFTSQSTDGYDSVPVNIALDAIYRIPADAAVTADMVGKTCDISKSSNVIKADVDASTYDVIQIVDVDITNQEVLVRLNPNKAAATGVA